MKSPTFSFRNLVSIGMATLLLTGPATHARSLHYETELARAGSVDEPYPPNDPLHLDEQEFSTEGEDPPFEDLTYAIEDGRLVVRCGKAWHRFTKIDALQFALDKDQDRVTLLDRAGAAFTIDMHLFRTAIFLAPVPVIQTDRVRLPPGDLADLAVVVIDKDVTASLYRGFNPWDLGPLVADKTRAWDAGNVLVLRKRGYQTEIIKEMPSDQIDRELMTIERTLKYFTDMSHPNGEAAAVAERNADIDWAMMLKLQKLDQATLHMLAKSAEYREARSQTPRDRYRFEGEIEVPLPDLSEARKWVTPRKMMLLAGATLGAQAAAQVAKRYETSVGLVHAIGITFANWAGLVSPVLVDSQYRKLLFKSALAMALIPPATWAVAMLADRVFTKYNDPGLTIVHGGMRAVGWMNEPFWRRMADVVRQPYLIRALSLGLNPLKVIEPDSALGRRAELDRATRTGWLDSREAGARTQRLVRTVETMQAQRFAYANWLALKVVSEEQRLDPATARLFARSDNPAARRALNFTPLMNRRRRQLSFELSEVLDRRPPEFDVAALDEAAEAADLREAKTKFDVIKARPWDARAWERVRRDWKFIRTAARRGLYDYARADNEFWRTARPKKSIGDINTTMYWSDFYESEFFTAVKSSRANLDDRPSLMAQADQWDYTNPGARFDVADTARWYAFNMPALLSRQYQRDQIRAGRSYNAREEELIKPLYRGPGIAAGLGYWLDDFRNPSTGRYGEIILNRFRLSTRMVQTTYTLTTLSRVLLAGADFATSSYNYLLHFIIGHPFIGLIWDGIIPTNERMYSRYEDNRARTEAAIGKIYRGLRMGEAETWGEGMRASVELFNDPQARATPEMKDYIARVNTYMFDSPSADQAQELMFRLLEKPPLPGKEPKWIEVAASLVGVFVSTYLGLKMSVLTFRPDLNWPHLLMQATGASVVFYGTVASMTKGWRWWQKQQREACEMNLLSPEMRAAVLATQ